MFNLIFSPFTKLLTGSVPETITSLPDKAADLVASIPARMADVVSFSPVDWLLDTLLDWRDAALGWLASAGQLGLLGVAGVVIYIIRARKEIEIERMRLVGMPPAPQLPREVKRSLVKYNLTAEWDGRDYWAVNQAGQKLKPITYLLEVKR